MYKLEATIEMARMQKSEIHIYCAHLQTFSNDTDRVDVIRCDNAIYLIAKNLTRAVTGDPDMLFLNTHRISDPINWINMPKIATTAQNTYFLVDTRTGIFCGLSEHQSPNGNGTFTLKHYDIRPVPMQLNSYNAIYQELRKDVDLARQNTYHYIRVLSPNDTPLEPRTHTMNNIKIKAFKEFYQNSL